MLLPLESLLRIAERMILGEWNQDPPSKTRLPHSPPVIHAPPSDGAPE